MKSKVMTLIYAGLIIFALFLFIGTDKEVYNGNGNVTETTGVVLKADNSDVVQTGIVRLGSQMLRVKVLKGKFKGQETDAVNSLIGKLDIDNFYKEGDKISIAIMSKNKKTIEQAKAIDLYRLDKELILFLIFIVCLLFFARTVGLKALLSFVASLLIIWRILIPSLLNGVNPILIIMIVLVLLTAIIIFSVAGFTKKAICAFLGTICGLTVAIILTFLIGDRMGMYGMTSPFSETLVFSGYMHLNMKEIFYGAIILGASGACMDISMDISAAMEEIKIKKPDISMKELIESGNKIGRAVIGTMTTTLLLAYSGGYLTLLMLFYTQNSSFQRIMNLKIVTAEIMRTLIGSTGLVLVAPITALICGWFYSIGENVE